MARSLSWIDSKRLSALLEVVSPSSGHDSAEGARSEQRDRADELEPERLSALFDEQSQPAPAPRPAPRATPKPTSRTAPAALRPARPAAPATPRPDAAPAMAAWQPQASQDLAARLEEFIDWVVGSTHIDAAFIADANGLVVVERGTGQIDPAMTCSVDLLLNHVSDVLQSEVDGYVALQRDGLHLVTLWTPTDYGRFYGVLISKAAPHPESLTLAGQGFRALFAN